MNTTAWLLLFYAAYNAMHFQSLQIESDDVKLPLDVYIQVAAGFGLLLVAQLTDHTLYLQPIAKPLGPPPYISRDWDVYTTRRGME